MIHSSLPLSNAAVAPGAANHTDNLIPLPGEQEILPALPDTFHMLVKIFTEVMKPDKGIVLERFSVESSIKRPACHGLDDGFRRFAVFKHYQLPRLRHVRQHLRSQRVMP